MTTKWYQPFIKAFKSTCYLIAHALVALVIVGVMTVIHRVLELDGNPKLFDRFPIVYIFQAADIAILAVFLVYGTVEAVQIFRETDDA